jgi:hypothetical protein
MSACEVFFLILIFATRSVNCCSIMARFNICSEYIIGHLVALTGAFVVGRIAWIIKNTTDTAWGRGCMFVNVLVRHLVNTRRGTRHIPVQDYFSREVLTPFLWDLDASDAIRCDRVVPLRISSSAVQLTGV